MDTAQTDTRAIARQIYRIRQERERRQREERIRYFKPCRPEDHNPNFPEMGCNDQWGFLYSPDTERWIFGGARSGKTESAVADAIMVCTGTHPVRSEMYRPPCYLRFIGTSWEDGIEKIIIPKFKEMVRRCDLKGGKWETAYHSTHRRLEFKNGSFVEFMTSEQSVDKHRGVKRHGIYMDEHHPKDYYDESIMRVIDYGGYIVGTMTPELGVTWQLDHVNNPGKASISWWNFWIFKNPFLPKESIDEVERKIKDEQLRKIKLYGEFVPLAGQVIPQWNRQFHIIPDRDIHPHAERVFCIDIHPKAPSAAVWAAWEPDKIYGYKLIIYRCVKEFLTVDEWKNLIRTQSSGERIVRWLADEIPGEEGSVDIHGQESTIAQFNSGSNQIPLIQVNKPKGSFDAGIFKLRDWFSVDPINKISRIYIFQSCDWPVKHIKGKAVGSLPWELDKYSFKTESKADEETLREKVRKVNDHLIDDVRYICVSGSPEETADVQPVFDPNPDEFTGW